MKTTRFSLLSESKIVYSVSVDIDKELLFVFGEWIKMFRRELTNSDDALGAHRRRIFPTFNSFNSIFIFIFFNPIIEANEADILFETNAVYERLFVEELIRFDSLFRTASKNVFFISVSAALGTLR